MNKGDLIRLLKDEAWYNRLEDEDKYGEDLQGDCISFIEKLIIEKDL